jgi:quinol monooxygenase YgiN
MAPVSEWTVVLRFDVPPEQGEAFLATATDAARLLRDVDGCQSVEVGRASDEPSLWLLCSRWRSVGEYRRALSSYRVRLEAVPFLSTARDEPSAFEVLFAVDEGGPRTMPGDLASDASSVDRSR